MKLRQQHIALNHKLRY